MSELPGFCPASFDEQVENLQQGGYPLCFFAVLALENIPMISEGTLNEFHDISDREWVVLIASLRRTFED